jgi:hypothetical protein
MINNNTAAEMRRKYPPLKVVEVLYKNDKTEKQYVTTHMRPKILTDERANCAHPQDHYVVCFEDTIVLKTSNLQLSDQGHISGLILFDSHSLQITGFPL